MKKLVEFIVANADKFKYDEYGNVTNLEYLNTNGKWIRSGCTDLYYDYKYRLTPEPKYIPFDYSDDLLGMKIVSKDNTVKQIITNAYKKSVYCGDYEMDYQDLFDDYIQLNGKPCGKSKV